MRTKLAPVLALALVAGALLAAFGSPAGSQEGGNAYRINVTKVVDGEGPVGPYAFNVTCTNPFSTPAGPFDFVLDDGQTETVGVTFFDTCTVTETDALGADSTTYACEVVADAVCDDEQTVTIDINDSNGEATVTVTNTFEADVIDDEEEPPPPTDADPDVVTATPPFTG